MSFATGILELVANVTKRAGSRTCSATNRRGEPCAKLAISDGLCLVHMPGGQDMSALGRAGGKARRGGLGKQLPPESRESLRAELQKLDPALVRTAIEQALSGGNESARVSAVKMLADLELYQRDKGAGCWRCAQHGMEVARLTASLKILYEVMKVEFVRVETEKEEWRHTLEQLEQLAAGMTSGNPDAIVVVGDVSPERAKAVLTELVEIGLLRPPDETLEEERLALKAERETLEREREELKAQRAEFNGS